MQRERVPACLPAITHLLHLSTSPHPQGTFHKASSVQLRNSMRTSDDEATRKACYEGLRSIGPFVAGALGRAGEACAR